MLHTQVQLDPRAQIRADFNEESRRVEIRAFDTEGQSSLLVEVTLDQMDALTEFYEGVCLRLGS